MDFAYTAEQDELRALARQVLADRATPERVAAVEATDERIDPDLWAALAASGLLGVAVPEEHGGGGLGLVELCILLEEVGRAVAPVPALATLVLGALPVAEHGSPEQRARYLPGVASGRLLLSGGLTEPRNPEPLAPVTRAAAPDGGWRLDGVKLGVPVASSAAALVVSATSGDGPALFLVDPHGPGVTLERQEVTNHEAQFLVTLDGAPGAAVRLPGGLAARGGRVHRRRGHPPDRAGRDLAPGRGRGRGRRGLHRQVLGGRGGPAGGPHRAAPPRWGGRRRVVPAAPLVPLGQADRAQPGRRDPSPAAPW